MTDKQKSPEGLMRWSDKALGLHAGNRGRCSYCGNNRRLDDSGLCRGCRERDKAAEEAARREREQKSPEEVARELVDDMWDACEIYWSGCSPEPGDCNKESVIDRYTSFIAFILRDRDAYWEKRVGERCVHGVHGADCWECYPSKPQAACLPSEEECETEAGRLQYTQSNLFLVPFLNGTRYMRTHLREAQLAAAWPEIVSLPVQTTRSQGLDGPMNEHEELVFANARKLPDLMTPSLCYSNGWVDALGFLRAKIKLVDVTELVSALEQTLSAYVELANSGDAGFWDPEEEDHVISARKALAKFREGK